MSKDIEVLVLDSGAFITGAKLDRCGPDTVYATVPSVVREVKDSRSRHILETFPYKIEQREVSSAAMTAVANFAQQTGDLPALSMPDLQVLALAYMYHVERHGVHSVRTEPLTKFDLDKLSSTSSGGRGDDGDNEDSKKDVCFLPQKDQQDQQYRFNAFNARDYLTQSPTSYFQKYNIQFDTTNANNGDKAINPTTTDNNPNTTPTTPAATQSAAATTTSTSTSTTNTAAILAVAAAAAAAGGGVSGKDDKEFAIDPSLDPFWQKAGTGDEEGEWITTDNIHEQTYKDTDSNKNTNNPRHRHRHKPKNNSNKNASSVACVTVDYAMQNVLLQMSLRLFSVNGLAIKSVRHTVLKCHACNTVERDTAKQFCSACGNHSLVKAIVRVNENGVARLFCRKVTTTRGTVYNIPRPRGGRDNKDLQLREDLFRGFGKKKDKGKNIFEDAIEFGYKRTGGITAYQNKQDMYGYGRKNPNEVRRTGNGAPVNSSKNKRNRRRR